jgi:hypothetical protein
MTAQDFKVVISLSRWEERDQRLYKKLQLMCNIFFLFLFVN